MEGFVPTRHAVHVLPEGELERKLKQGRPLRVKLGLDPTAPDVHLGFAVVLDRLREWQDAGHIVVLIVGDYTARIGDPSGRSAERPVLPDEVLDANAKHFADQAFRILDRDQTEVRLNGEWLGKLNYAEVACLTRTATVARLLERNDFAKRFAARQSDLGLRAPLSTVAGLRLRRDQRRHRDWWHRSTLQPPHRAAT